MSVISDSDTDDPHFSKRRRLSHELGFPVHSSATSFLLPPPSLSSPGDLGDSTLIPGNQAHVSSNSEVLMQMDIDADVDAGTSDELDNEDELSTVAVSSSSSQSSAVSSRNHSSSQQLSISSKEQQVVVKRRIYHRRANPFPRVLKRDIRRDYGAMLINVLNSFDGDLTAKFFTQFCVQDCHKLDLFPEVTKHYNLPGFRHVGGLNQIVYHLLHDLSHIPDSVFHMKGSLIRQRSDIQGSQVCVRVLFQGTKIYMNQDANAQALMAMAAAAIGNQSNVQAAKRDRLDQFTAALSGQQQFGNAAQHIDVNNAGNNSSSSEIRFVDNNTSSSSSVRSQHSSAAAANDDSNSTSTDQMNDDLPSASLWMPLPPELDEQQLNSIDIQTLERELQSYSERHRTPHQQSPAQSPRGRSNSGESFTAENVAGLLSDHLRALSQGPGDNSQQSQAMIDQLQQLQHQLPSNLSLPTVFAEAAAAFASSNGGRQSHSSLSSNSSSSPSLSSLLSSFAAQAGALPAAQNILASLAGHNSKSMTDMLSNALSAAASSSHTSSGVSSSSSATTSTASSGVTMLPKPFQLTVDGIIIMHLDEEHRVHRLEFMSSSLCASHFGLENGSQSSNNSVSSRSRTSADKR